MKVKLTQAMIDTGIKRDCGKCPLALMLFEAIPSAHRVEVDVMDNGTRPWAEVDDNEVIFSDPEKVAEFLVRFDNGKKVKPMFVEFDVLEPANG